MKQGVVYWKHLPDMTDYYIDGYVGITNDFDRRMREHKRASELNSILRIHDKMRTHGDEIKTSIIFKGNYNDCLNYEEELRPRWHIGWNMAIGGGRPGSGWKPNPLWLDNTLFHNINGYEEISEHNNLATLAKKYDVTHKCFSEVLLGRRPQSAGWELRDAQLVQRINERYRADWEYIYATNNIEIIKLYKTGQNKLAKHMEISRNKLGMKLLATYARPSIKGWKLATEEEWLTTKERIEFK